MSENLNIYDKVRAVPELAKKPISGGRLNGKTDINPMWRIKTLTELFGPCGIGWRYEITGKHLERGFGDEIAAFVDINLFIKHGGEWSAAIPGTGGSMFVAKEKAGPYTSDECYKMALTDALSVACKALGVGADVYWDKDSTKYDRQDAPKPTDKPAAAKAPAAPVTAEKVLDPAKITDAQRKALVARLESEEDKARLLDILRGFGYQKSGDIKPEHYDEICKKYDEHGLPFSL